MTAAIPLASTVFPAPSGPESTTTSPARSCSPNRDPSATVSSTRSSVCGDRKGGEAGRSGSPPSDVCGDRKGGEAGRSGSPPSGVCGDRKGGEAGRSGSPPSDPRSCSAMAAEPSPQPPVPQGHLARNGPVDQPDQPVVDGIGLIQQRQVTGPVDDDQFG